MVDLPPLPPPGEAWALFLDVDGTLVPIARTPHEVRVADHLPGLLGRLRQSLGGALALVSGRSLLDIDALFAPLALPAAGLHGQERRRADGRLVPAGPVDMAALDDVRRVAIDYASTHAGVLVEDKGLSVALHYRLAPELGPLVRALAQQIALQHPSLRLIDGRKVVEFVTRGSDKGGAITAFMTEAPFHGRRPVFAGDDVTDEDGFAAVNSAGGLSIKVIGTEASPHQTRPTRAQCQVGTVADLHAWLAAVVDRLGAVAAAGATPEGLAPQRRYLDDGTFVQRNR